MDVNLSNRHAGAGPVYSWASLMWLHSRTECKDVRTKLIDGLVMNGFQFLLFKLALGTFDIDRPNVS
jgi:hypothetical protein